MLLEARELEAGYGHAQVLFGISLQIAQGEVVTDKSIECITCTVSLHPNSALANDGHCSPCP